MIEQDSRIVIFDGKRQVTYPNPCSFLIDCLLRVCDFRRSSLDALKENFRNILNFGIEYCSELLLEDKAIQLAGISKQSLKALIKKLHSNLRGIDDSTLENLCYRCYNLILSLEKLGPLRGFKIGNRWGDVLIGDPERVSVMKRKILFSKTSKTIYNNNETGSMNQKQKEKGDKTMELLKIKEAARVLNKLGADVAKMKVDLSTDENLAERFMMAVEAVPLERENELPQVVVDTYNALVEEQNLAETSLPAATEQVKGKTKTSIDFSGEKQQRRKEKKVKESKTVQKKGLSRYGHRLGTASACLDELFFKGTTLEEAAREIKSSVNRVRIHLSHLKKDRGLEFIEKDGFYKVKNGGRD